MTAHNLVYMLPPSIALWIYSARYFKLGAQAKRENRPFTFTWVDGAALKGRSASPRTAFILGGACLAVPFLIALWFLRF